MYRSVDAAMVRISALSPADDVPPWPNMTGSPDDQVDQWRQWLRLMWASDRFAAAVELASPVLAKRVRKICSGDDHKQRQVQRAALSVARYALRMTSRATPFGLFAGVAPARLGEPTRVRVGQRHHAVVRIDTEWLADVIASMEAQPRLRKRLLVVGNNLVAERDGKLIVDNRQQPGGSTKKTTLAEVSIRNTRAVQLVMRAARTPTPVANLLSELLAEFPATPEAKIAGMLSNLVTHGFLITSLRPNMTEVDPLGHVIDRLTDAGARLIAETREKLDDLRSIHAESAVHADANSPTRQAEIRTAVIEEMQTVSSVERPITVDLRLDCDLALPSAVLHEVEAAAATLVRLTPHPDGLAGWGEYHHSFLERYGIGALVPITEITNAEVGLGFPAGYRDSHRSQAIRHSLSERDTTLLSWAQTAALEHATELVLDDDMVADLAAGGDANERVQPHTELCFRVQANALDSIERGEFQLAVTGVSRAAGVTAGRFLDLLVPDDRASALAAYAQLPTISEDALQVQLSCAPLASRADGVTRSPTVLRPLLALAEYRADGEPVIQLDDLAVSADARRLYLISMSRRRPVEPLMFNAVELSKQVHPLVRFLYEISTARAAPCAPFSWGAADRLPFLPRLRYKRTILSPARWTLSTTTLPDSTADLASWASSMERWRQRYGVPHAVYFGEGDLRIRLNLRVPAHQYLLRDMLQRTGHATLREAPPESAFGWIGGRAHEIVVPLSATSRPVPRREWPGSAIGREHGQLPATGDWLYIKMYGHPDRQTEILITHLSEFFTSWDVPPEWWFVRYRDPEPHLRIRIRLRSGDGFGPTAQRIGAWASELRRLGLVGPMQVDTYYPETGRFGKGAAMAAAESMFAADSAVAIALLRLAEHVGAPHQYAVLAASMVDLITSAVGNTADGMRWLIDHLNTSSAPANPRDVHDQAIRLANPHGDWAALRGIEGGGDVLTAWTARRAALAEYRDMLTDSGDRVLDSVLPDLLHLHHVRMIGISPDAERACGRLARAAALSWTTRRRGKS